MALSKVAPLAWNAPIVDEKGNPTPYFQRQLQQLLEEKAATDTLAEGSLPNSASSGIILGRATAGDGPIEELTLSQALDLIGSAAQGDLLYRGAAGWQRLPAGTSGQFLKTLGSGADPAWGTVSGGAGGGYEAGPAGDVPSVASLTWLNQGTSTAADGTGMLLLYPQTNGQLHSLITPIPSVPFSVYGRIELNNRATSPTGVFSNLGCICFRNSANGNLVTFSFQEDRVNTSSGIAYYSPIQRWTSSGVSFSATAQAAYGTRPWKWWKADVTSTTITGSVSMDGKNWIQVGTETIATFIGAITDYGVGSYSANNAVATTAMFSYLSTTTPA
jgi:hypothetical protein